MAFSLSENSITKCSRNPGNHLDYYGPFATFASMRLHGLSYGAIKKLFASGNLHRFVLGVQRETNKLRNHLWPIDCGRGPDFRRNLIRRALCASDRTAPLKKTPMRIAAHWWNPLAIQRYI
jgi:hypothetical protein